MELITGASASASRRPSTKARRSGLFTCAVMARILSCARSSSFCNRSYGPPREVEIEGKEKFKGVQYHSAKHFSAKALRQTLHCPRANSSAHDICADFWENDAEVTMIQRTPTTVVRSETLMDVAFWRSLFGGGGGKGDNVDTADLIFASLPFRLMPLIQKQPMPEMARRDADLIARLNKAGFRTDYGVDDSVS